MSKRTLVLTILGVAMAFGVMLSGCNRNRDDGYAAKKRRSQERQANRNRRNDRRDLASAESAITVRPAEVLSASAHRPARARRSANPNQYHRSQNSSVMAPGPMDYGRQSQQQSSSPAGYELAQTAPAYGPAGQATHLPSLYSDGGLATTAAESLYHQTGYQPGSSSYIQASLYQGDFNQSYAQPTQSYRNHPAYSQSPQPHYAQNPAYWQQPTYAQSYQQPGQPIPSYQNVAYQPSPYQSASYQTSSYQAPAYQAPSSIDPVTTMSPVYEMPAQPVTVHATPELAMARAILEPVPVTPSGYPSYTQPVQNYPTYSVPSYPVQGAFTSEPHPFSAPTQRYIAPLPELEPVRYSHPAPTPFPVFEPVSPIPEVQPFVHVSTPAWDSSHQDIQRALAPLPTPSPMPSLSENWVPSAAASRQAW